MDRKVKVAGALFLISTAAYLIGSGILNPLLQKPGVLEEWHDDRALALAGMFLELVNALAVSGIAFLLYPALKRHNEAFAIGYFGSRLLESAILIVSLIAPMLLLPLSKEYITAAEAAGRFSLTTIANTAVDAHFMLFELAMVVLSLGSLLFCSILYRSKLVPRWLSVIGFIGYAGLLTSSCLAIAGHDIGAVLYIPGALFEIVLPIWLMVKGLHSRH
ncbi:DUF4386 domain-containing protein [Paenibacillus agaridevorans]|uniref:DUF4386 domain-containing protein n=1 Tax=Paenibacillus agaridevorans TaxID=171404 RepID=A0A2R5ETH4_9BACL|nr:DUF4386 domain-containing protein [Paenibacillus agaridevorans]GBG08348.1 DUF4386 domain-containing protein [Paenibacillus agaridevorans]